MNVILFLLNNVIQVLDTEQKTVRCKGDGNVMVFSFRFSNWYLTAYNGQKKDDMVSGPIAVILDDAFNRLEAN